MSPREGLKQACSVCGTLGHEARRCKHRTGKGPEEGPRRSSRSLGKSPLLKGPADAGGRKGGRGGAGRRPGGAAPKARETGASSSTAPFPFHVAFPVGDLEEARAFYGGVLGLEEGRRSARWQDYSLFGHQIVCHLVDGYHARGTANAVDGDPVPVPHFGVCLSVEAFHAFAAALKAKAVNFIIEPHLRFEGKPGEQWTMFFKDPSGNSLEFKAMTEPANLFAKYVVEP